MMHIMNELEQLRQNWLKSLCCGDTMVGHPPSICVNAIVQPQPECCCIKTLGRFITSLASVQAGYLGTGERRT